MGEGDEKSQAQVQDLMPRRVKKRRKIETEDGSDQGWEEYFDYIFPEDEAAKPNLKLLAMAKMWKKQKDTVADDDTAEDRAQDEDERIPIVEEGDAGNVDEENPDADDQDIVNESSDESGSDDEDEGSSGESEAKKKRLK